jgi:hypothetical protein
MHRHRSSAMRFSIAVVALPRLDEKSLSRATRISAEIEMTVYNFSGRNDLHVLRPGDHE